MSLKCACVEMRWGLRWFMWGSTAFALLWTWVGCWRSLVIAEMEKDKKRFNLTRLLTLYLPKKNKALAGSPAHCNSCRSTAATSKGTDTSPPPRNRWTVKWYLLLLTSWWTLTGLQRAVSGVVKQSFLNEQAERERLIKTAKCRRGSVLAVIGGCLETRCSWKHACSTNSGFLLSNKVPSCTGLWCWLLTVFCWNFGIFITD